MLTGGAAHLLSEPAVSYSLLLLVSGLRTPLGDWRFMPVSYEVALKLTKCARSRSLSLAACRQHMLRQGCVVLCAAADKQSLCSAAGLGA